MDENFGRADEPSEFEPDSDPVAKLKVAAVYDVRVTLRGEEGIETPTLTDVENAISGAVAGIVRGTGESTVKSSAERVDR